MAEQHVIGTEQRISKHLIDSNPDQPRKFFDREKLEGLRDSILAIGQQNPISVVRKDDGRYQIVVGERRWRAFNMIEDEAFTEMRATIVPSDTDADLWAIIENVQREPLNPIEEAEGYDRIIKKHKLNQRQLAARIGRSEFVISRLLGLLKLPDSVKKLVAQDLLRPAAAYVLIARCQTPAAMEEVVNALRKQHHGTTKITASAISKYLDAQEVPKHLHPRAKSVKESAPPPAPETLSPVNGTVRVAVPLPQKPIAGISPLLMSLRAFLDELDVLLDPSVDPDESRQRWVKIPLNERNEVATTMELLETRLRRLRHMVSLIARGR